MKQIFIFFFILLAYKSLGQKSAYFNDYRSYTNIKSGTYVTKSTLKDCLNLNLPVITNNTKSIQFNNYDELTYQFIKITEQPVVLFDSHDPEKMRPIAIVKETIQVAVDSILYKEIYRDYTKPWSVSFNVWNRIIVDGKAYYTDYDLHDSQIMLPIEQLNQKVLVVGQNTGYDYGYHIGYTEYYFLLFLNKENEVIYESDIIDITFGDEFGMPEDFIKTNWNNNTQGFEITFFNQFVQDKKTVRLIWNGKNLRFKL